METFHSSAVGLKCFSDLNGQLARGCQHQHLSLIRFGIYTRQGRQGKCRGFTGTGLSGTQQVVAV